MKPQSAPADVRKAESLSALVDGEIQPDELDGMLAAWRDDPAQRRRWHDYQLIGDVLRSDDLAAEPAHDAAFLQRLRERLAAEPVVLAPAPRPVARPDAATARRPRPGRWAASAAVAAACVLVIGALIVTRGPGEPAAGPQLAAAPAELRPVLVGPDAPSPLVNVAVPQAEAGGVLRDAGLDHYLAAHKQFADRLGSGEPSPFLRSAAHADPER